MRHTPVEASTQPIADPHTEVGMMYIAEYLKSKDCSLEKLATLPPVKAKALMEAASQYASLRLAQLEMGAAFVDAIHQESTLTTVAAASVAPQP